MIVAFYVEKATGAGCGSELIRTADECSSAAASLGYSADVISQAVTHAPLGCFVGHPSDAWHYTYFNTVCGETGREIYKSICKSGMKTIF